MSAAGERPRIAAEQTTDILRRRAEFLAAEQTEAREDEHEEILLFTLGEETYGVRIASVREIANDYSITPIPCVPDFILGVISIRGETVSVTDLARLLRVGVGRPSETPDGEQPPLIVAVEGRRCTALVVDEIGDIVGIAAGSVEPPIAVADKVQSEFVSGGFYHGGQLVALVNADKVLTPVGGE